MKVSIIVISLLFVFTSGFSGWILPSGVKEPQSYESIDRKKIVEFNTAMTNARITYRSGHYTSLMQYSGSFSDTLVAGTIIVYKTSSGNYGKMKITGYAQYHAWSKVMNYQYCDVPFFVFTTYLEEGSPLVSGGYPIILDSYVRANGYDPLQGIGPITYWAWKVDLRSADYYERPQGSSFMWFYFDFDTNQTGFYNNYNGVQFSGADLHNEKNETKSRFSPINGAIFAVVYKP